MSEIVKATHPFKAMQQISRNLENMIAFKKAEQRADQEALVEKKQQTRLQAASTVAAPVAFGGLIMAAGALSAYLSKEIKEIFDKLHEGLFDILGIKPDSVDDGSISAYKFEKISPSPADDMTDLPPAEKLEKTSDIEYDTIGKKLYEVDQEQNSFFKTIRDFFGFDVPKPDTGKQAGVAVGKPAPSARPAPAPAGIPARQAQPSPRQQRQAAAREKRETAGAPVPHRTPAGVYTGGGGAVDTSNLPKYTPGTSGGGGSPAGNMDMMNRVMDERGFTGESQRAGLAAITVGESGFRSIPENMNYSAQRLREVFGYEHPGGWDKVVAGGEQAIAEAVYGYQSRNPAARNLGNDKPGDGWNYRGKGFIQITGKANYADLSKRIGLDLVSNPDALLDPEIAAKAAVAFMQRSGSPSDFGAQLAAVGGSREGWARKRQYYQQFMRDGTFKSGSGRGTPQPTATASVAPPPEDSKQSKIKVVDASGGVNRQTVSATPPLPTDKTLEARNFAAAQIAHNQNLSTATGIA
jgi:predicted chitinase